jgi:hypothetical protein
MAFDPLEVQPIDDACTRFVTVVVSLMFNPTVPEPEAIDADPANPPFPLSSNCIHAGTESFING